MQNFQKQVPFCMPRKTSDDINNKTTETAAFFDLSEALSV